jgi:type I restriction enzyme S subunit
MECSSEYYVPETVNLKENCELIQYGFTQSASEAEVGPKFLRITDIQKNPVDWSTVPYCEISKEDFRKYLLQPGDIVVARTGASTGTSAIYKENMPESVFASYLIRVRPTASFLPDFVYYFLQSDFYIEHVKSIVGGSAQPNANAIQLTDVQIPLMTIEAQKQVCNLLGCLDNKISTNIEINKILEEIARVIFKHWFIDFEFPNENGEPHKSSGGEMIDSSLGPIPKGWRIGRIEDVCEFSYGKALKADKRIQGRIPVYGSNGQIGWHNESLVSGPGIIVGRKGNPGLIHWSKEDFFPIDTTFYVVPRVGKSIMHFLYFALKHADLPRLSADSAVPGLNRNIAYMQQLVIPTEQLLRDFEKRISFIFDLLQTNSWQNQSLSELRDTLLPKLMSGEIRVPVSEKEDDQL